MSEEKIKDVSRETLASYRISFEENPGAPHPATMPQRVRALREGLLSCRGRLAKDHIDHLSYEEKKGLPDEETIYMTRRDDDREMMQKLKAQTDLAVTISKKARILKADHRQEKRWEYLLFDTVFKHLEDALSPANGYWNDYKLGPAIALESNHLWNEDHNIPKDNSSHTYLTEPKPDIYLGFPIKNSSYQELDGFWADPSNENFSIEILGKLLNEGLVCTPTTGVRRYLHRKGGQAAMGQSGRIFMRDESIEQQGIDSGVEDEPKFSKDHLLCFPWAVVELKHEDVPRSEKQKCYGQGANAASRALRIFGILSRYADAAEGGQHVPPVVVLTFIGPLFKLWIAYSKLDSNGITNYVMFCIEERSIDTFWGALRLCHIVDDMSFWATRILKPQISMYIDQWRSRHMIGLRFQVAQDSKLFALIRKVEQCERDLGLPRSTNLAETIRFALIMSEVSSTQEKRSIMLPKPISTSSQTISSNQPSILPVKDIATKLGNITRRVKVKIPSSEHYRNARFGGKANASHSTNDLFGGTTKVQSLSSKLFSNSVGEFGSPAYAPSSSIGLLGSTSNKPDNVNNAQGLETGIFGNIVKVFSGTANMPSSSTGRFGKSGIVFGNPTKTPGPPDDVLGSTKAGIDGPADVSDSSDSPVQDEDHSSERKEDGKKNKGKHQETDNPLDEENSDENDEGEQETNDSLDADNSDRNDEEEQETEDSATDEDNRPCKRWSQTHSSDDDSTLVIEDTITDPSYLGATRRTRRYQMSDF